MSSSNFFVYSKKSEEMDLLLARLAHKFTRVVLYILCSPKIVHYQLFQKILSFFLFFLATIVQFVSSFVHKKCSSISMRFFKCTPKVTIEFPPHPLKTLVFLETLTMSNKFYHLTNGKQSNEMPFYFRPTRFSYD